MTEKSLFWGTASNTGDGSSSGYSASELFQFFRAFCHETNIGGVFPNHLNELVVAGTATPVTVATGAAIVYGIPYLNSVSENVTIPTPAAQTRIDRIVLRASWAAQTVRITRIAGAEGGSAPAMTQTPSTTWDFPLAQVSITTGGVITVTDERAYIGMLGAYMVDPRSHISGTNGIVIDPQNGNSRGDDAVDLQTTRAAASEVASGAKSVVAGGYGNTASGVNSVVSGGYANSVTVDNGAVVGGVGNVVNGTYGAIGGGTNNTISGTRGTIAGGEGNTAVTYGTVGGGQTNTADGDLATIAGGKANGASGSRAAIGGGEENTASGVMSAINGGYFAVADKYGQEAHASGRFAADGDAQRSTFTLRNSTANATPTELFLDGSAERMVLPSDTAWAFSMLIVARRTDANNESAAYEFKGCIDNNAGTVALVGSVTKTVIAEDTSAWDVNVTADDTNNALVITVTGEGSKTIRWVATVWTTEVTG